MIKNALILIVAMMIFGCNNKSSKDSHEKIGELKNTKWIHQPFKEYKDCIDTLTFSTESYGVNYSCEHEFHDSIVYEINNDTLFIEKFGYASEFEPDQELVVMSKYKLIGLKGDLKMVDIKHRNNDFFNSVDPKFIVGKTYKKIK
jgi:hypothetical protein